MQRSGTEVLVACEMYSGNHEFAEYTALGTRNFLALGFSLSQSCSEAGGVVCQAWGGTDVL